MSEKRAVYIGPSGTGVDLAVPLANGEIRNVHVDHGDQLPTEIDGVAVPASFRDGLLEQEDNWSPTRRAGGAARGPTVADLKAQAKALGIPVPSKAKKDDIAALIAAHGSGEDDSTPDDNAHDSADGASGQEE
jgi:hypothetical protein